MMRRIFFPVITVCLALSAYHDLLTGIMPFADGGYYNYDRLLYKAGQTDPSGVRELRTADTPSDYYYDLQGRRYAQKPTRNGIYIKDGMKVVVDPSDF